MPVMRKANEKLFTKVIMSKGYGFNSPQNGSVCKIQIILDEANLLTGLDAAASKEIVVGDVDDYVDRIIEDCIQTMKEEEECCIEFPLSDSMESAVMPSKRFSDVKDINDSPEKIKTDVDDNAATGNKIQKPEIDPDGISECAKSGEDNTCCLENREIDPSTCTKAYPSQMVKIQFKLLSFTREPEIWEMSVTEKWRRANYHKQKGMELYAQTKYQYAFRRFGLTLKYLVSLEHDVPSGEDESLDIKGLKLSCYLNIAACQMRHDNFEFVVINSTKALNLQPNNAKALYRRGAAYVQLQEYEKAKEDLTLAQQLEPKNQAIVKQLKILRDRVQKLNQYYANAMKKMFS